MAEFLAVLLLSGAMFVGCIVAGWIPLAFSLSARKIQLFTVFGAGLLVGTALSVIIPEGVDAMYSSRAHVTSNPHLQIEKSESIDGKHIDQMTHPKDVNTILKESESHEHHHIESPHRAVGLALLLGFVFMLLVDQIGGATHSHAPDNIRLDELNQSKVGLVRAQQSDQKSKGYTATIGLVVHAAADGIALGAAASTHRQDLQFIVFLAIMLHKAPAAFGLVSFLVHEGLELRKIKKHLLLFALAAPVLAILTFALLNRNEGLLSSDVDTTGVAMLFSAGTFLYVATVHVLPEISHSNSGSKGLNLIDVGVLVLGTLFPLILNLGHHH